VLWLAGGACPLSVGILRKIKEQEVVNCLTEMADKSHVSQEGLNCL